MKKSFPVLAAAAFAALSCSSMSQLQTQVYDDGVYTRPSVEVAQTVTDAELDNLLADTQQSPAYVLSEGDTLVVPAGKQVRFSTTNTLVTVVDTPSWIYDYSWAYRPWYLRDYYYTWHSPWYHSYYSWTWDPWYYSSWYYDPWYYDSWYYRPWHHYGYYGYYSPWYYSSWYGPYDFYWHDSWYWGHRYGR